MGENDFHKIIEKIDQLIAIEALVAVKGLKPTEAILALGSAGLDRNLIAQLTGSTPLTVSVRLSEAKARVKKKPPAKRGSRSSPKKK